LLHSRHVAYKSDPYVLAVTEPHEVVNGRQPGPGARTRLLECAAVFVLTAFFSFSARSEALTEAEIGSRPTAGGPADVVTVHFFLVDIVEIIDRQQLFNIDAYVEVSWRDPRLRSDSVAEGELRSFAASEIWTPSLLILNNRGLQRLLPDVVTVDGEGNVVLRQRLAGPLATDLKLRDFPFDSQALPIDVVSYQYAPSELTFSADSEIVTNVGSYRSKGWNFDVGEPSFLTYRLVEDGRGTSMLRYTVIAERKSGYYVLTLAIPTTLILFLAWLVHWLPPTVIPSRIGMSSATVFSIIALGVSFRLTLPAIDYLTRADRFVVFATLLVAASLAVTVTASTWASLEKLDEANRLTRRMRVLFPIAYAAIVLVALYV
jgi:hypothetical protein